MLLMPLLLAWSGADARAADLVHDAGLRYRRANLPGGLLGIGYFDAKDDGGLPYDRPKVNANVFGVEYTVSMRPDGGPSFVFWGERISMRMGTGYWDDVETPPNHDDGTWLEPQKGLGMWAIGANYANEIPLSETSKPVWVGLAMGGGIGIGVVTGSILQWFPGYHPGALDPDCGFESAAPDRVGVCVNDGEIRIPGALPIIDLTIGPKVHIGERAMVRLDLGLHNLLYFGFAGGGTF